LAVAREGRSYSTRTANASVTEALKRDLRRRSAVEPCIGHLKSEHRMGRNHLAHAAGDATHAVRAAAGYNFRRLLAWPAVFLRPWLAAITAVEPLRNPVGAASIAFFAGDDVSAG